LVLELAEAADRLGAGADRPDREVLSRLVPEAEVRPRVTGKQLLRHVRDHLHLARPAAPFGGVLIEADQRILAGEARDVPLLRRVANDLQPVSRIRRGLPLVVLDALPDRPPDHPAAARPAPPIADPLPLPEQPL